jgi:hypothetical protein
MWARARHFLEERLDRDRVRFVCWVLLLINLVLLAVAFLTADNRQTIFGPSLGADYAAFYGAGALLNEYPPERLYDLKLQDRLYHQLMPHESAEDSLPYANPPFLALPFRLLALLPYEWSFLVWLLLGAGLYLAGFALVWSTLKDLPAVESSTPLLLALSFEPFLVEAWVGGQLSAVGFFWIALALRCDRLHRPFLSGLALGFCLYKPTLLPLLLPMMVIARRWWALGGFVVCAFGLASVSLLAVGWQGCRDYVALLLGYASASTGSAPVFRLWKFVDLSSFFKLLLGGPSPVGWALLVAAVAASSPFLVRAWWAFGRLAENRQQLVWACTITWTLVFNLYVGIYDSTLAVLGALLTADALCQQKQQISQALTPTFKSLLVLLYLTPWASQFLARGVGFQPYTLVLLAVGAYQLALARARPEGPRMES